MSHLNLDDDPAFKFVRDHAWDWFSLHASQRMQTFNFYLIMTGFLVAGYGALVEKHRFAAGMIALIGAGITYVFHRLDARTRQLMKASERALQDIEAMLADSKDKDHWKIVEHVERPARGASTVRQAISMIQWTLIAAFLCGAAYAFWLPQVDAAINAAFHV